MAADREVNVPLWNIANILTMTRVLMIPVFVWLCLQQGWLSQLLAAAVFVLAAITDRIDGHLARTRGLITNFGKILDPIADKALVISALLLLSIPGVVTPEGPVPWWVTVVIIARELGITVLRFFMIRREVMAASKGGKIKTTLQIIFLVGMLTPWDAFLPGALATFLMVASVVLMYLAVLVTVWTGLQYVVDAWRISRAHGA